MNEEEKDVKKEEEKKETEVNEEPEVLDELPEEDCNDSDYVTREINLDDLYDGAINNTVVIDPVTNNEVLLSNKKPNYTLLGIIVAIIILLVLYYINNKSDLGRTTKDVEPKTTTTLKTTAENDMYKTGTLTCNYSSKSDAESQSVTYVADYEEGAIQRTNFSYVVVSNTENTSAVVEDLKTQYENFFINNVSVNGNNVSYEKNSKGFTFNVETNYAREGFDGLVTTENQTILFVKPTTGDTVESLQKAYTDKGFTCSLTSNKSEE